MGRRLLVVALTVLGASLAVPGAASPRSPLRLEAPVGTTRHADPYVSSGKRLPFAADTRARAARAARQARRRPVARAVGDVQLWLALDDVYGVLYLKSYTLRGVGDHVEVWVANDEDGISRGLEFPAGDCRNDERTRIANEQVGYLIREYDRNILPAESAAFSVAPDRAGTYALLPAEVGLPADYFAGDGDDVVVLVDNVRDANFYDPSNSTNQPYIAGFFDPFITELVDRNVMTVDGFDWLHRTGANPPNDPVPGDFCRSKPARPHDYEATFAHEYQHLLEYYADYDETAWVNEGLSDYAQTVTGYASPRLPITDQGFDGHVQCFLGYLGVATAANPTPRAGGPENSLTAWGDQGDDEIVCDYGAAYTFMEFLAGRYGPGFMAALHADPENGLASVRGLIRAGGGSKRDAREILHDWAAMVALDSSLDAGARLAGGPADRYRAPSLAASVNWETEHAYATPGAPPNGSDYVRLRGGSGGFLGSSQLRSLTFAGAAELPALPVEWTVDGAPPGRPGDPALHSGSGPNLDRAIVYEVEVPARNATLTFATRFDTEAAFDFAFVQVSTDGGETYRSLANDLTTAEADPTADPRAVANLPGLNGTSGGGAEAAWISTSFDLSAYRGRTILIAFRYVTDPAVDLPGWWIDDVRVGDQVLTEGSSLAGARTPTEIRPARVSGFTVQLVGYSTSGPHRAFVHRLPLNARFEGHVGGKKLRQILARGYDVVAAIVTQDDPTETITQYAPYTLSLAADDVVQPGGARALQPGGRAR